MDIKCKSSKSAILLKVLPGNKTALNHAMRLHFCKNKATKSNCSCTFLWRLLAILSSTFRKPFDFFVNFVQLIIAMYAHSIQINIVCTTKLHQNYVKQWHTSLVIYGQTEGQMDGRKVKEGRKGGKEVEDGRKFGKDWFGFQLTLHLHHHSLKAFPKER